MLSEAYIFASSFHPSSNPKLCRANLGFSLQDREAEPRFTGPPSARGGYEGGPTRGGYSGGGYGSGYGGPAAAAASGGGGGGGGAAAGGKQIFVNNVCPSCKS